MFLRRAKDGGVESKVTGYWLLEIKALFSIVLLRFDEGSRDAYHDHAFNAWSWLLRGELFEKPLEGRGVWHTPSWRPIFTARERFHKVYATRTTWVLSFRGPWAKTWREYIPATGGYVTLTNGRKLRGE